MKTYNKPTTVALNIRTKNIIAASGNYNETIDLGGSGSGDGNDLTREKKGGVGGGLWSDMK